MSKLRKALAPLLMTVATLVAMIFLMLLYSLDCRTFRPLITIGGVVLFGRLWR